MPMDDVMANPSQGPISAELGPGTPAANPQESGEPTASTPDEAKMRDLTGGRYTSPEALWQAKQGTDQAFRDMRGENLELAQRLAVLENTVANPPQAPLTAESVRQKLDGVESVADAVPVILEAATQAAAMATQRVLEPLAAASNAEMQVMSTNPDYADSKGDIHAWLARNPAEQETVNRISAADPAAGLRYGIARYKEANAEEKTVKQEPQAAATAAELEHSRVHGAVPRQGHHSTATSAVTQQELERDAWNRGQGVADTSEYAARRLDYLAEQHPDLKKVMDAQRGGIG